MLKSSTLSPNSAFSRVKTKEDPLFDGSADSSSQKVKVAVRIRPLMAQGEISSAWQLTDSNNTIYQLLPSQEVGSYKAVPGSFYTFDKIFDDKTTTASVYSELASDIISSCMNGINGTIFAYGQTSSGKTYTMQGTKSSPGIISLSIKDVFNFIEKHSHGEFLLRVSYLEIYNEVIKDLLQPNKDNLKIHENINKGIFIGDLSEVVVSSVKEAQELLLRGEGNRHVGETNMNERSSRSHTIFKMVIESRDLSSPTSSRASFSGAVKVSCLNLVDLAGSERVGHTGAEGIRLKEGGHINKSLLALGSVIAKLSEGGDKKHIPYRDSKLTRILQPSLGGNANTAIICTITPASNYCDETVSTLKFASRAKNIRNKPEVNEVMSSEEALLKKYRIEIEDLRSRLEKNSQIENNNMGNNLIKSEDEESEKKGLIDKIDELKRVILSSTNLDTTNPPPRKKMVRRKTWFAGSISNQTFLEDEEESTILTSEVVAPVAAATAHLTQNQYIHVVAKSSAVQSAPPSARKVDIAENDDHLPDDDRRSICTDSRCIAYSMLKGLLKLFEEREFESIEAAANSAVKEYELIAERLKREMLIEGVKASGLEAKLVVDENVSNFQQLITLICGNNEKEMDQNLFRERAEMRKLLDQELQLASQDKETHLNLLQKQQQQLDQLNSEIGDNRAKIGEYENLLKDVQQTAKHDRERLEHELKTVKLLEDKIVSISSLLEDQTNAFEVERQDLLSSRDTLQAKLDSLKQQETSQKVELSQYQALVEKLRLDVAESMNQIQEISINLIGKESKLQLLAAENSQIPEYTQNISELKSMLSQEKDKSKALLEQQIEMEQFISDLKCSHSNELLLAEARSAKLQSQLEEAQVVLNNTSLKMEELKSSNASETEALHMELHRLKTQASSLGDLYLQVQGSQVELHDMTKEKENMSNINAEIKLELDNLRTRFAQERSSGAEQINILNETIDQLVEAKDVERFDLREKIANLQVECQRLQTNMETKDSQILSLGKKLADAESIKSREQELEDRISQLVDHLQLANSSSGDFEALIVRLKSNEKEYRSKLEMSNQNAIDLLTELEDLKKVNKGLQQKLAANPTSNTDPRAVKELLEAKDKVQLKYGKLYQEAENLRCSLDAINQRESVNAAKIEESQDQVKKLKRKLMDQESRLLEFQNDNLLLTEELKAMRSIQEKPKQISGLEAKVDERSSLENELACAQSKINNLAAALREAEIDRLELSNLQDASSIQMKHTLSQITAGFESDRFALQNQLEDIKKENSLLKNEAEKGSPRNAAVAISECLGKFVKSKSLLKDLCKCSNMEDLVSCLKQIDLTEAVAQVETSQVDLLRKQLTQLQKEKESWCTLKKYDDSEMEKLKALNKKLKLESIQLKNILKSSESISATSSGDKENDDMRFLKKPNSNLKNKTSQECNQQ